MKRGDFAACAIAVSLGGLVCLVGYSVNGTAPKAKPLSVNTVRTCPVAGDHCKCGCISGDSCNCAAGARVETPEPPVAPAKPRDIGFAQYCSLVCGLKPGDRFEVWVRRQPTGERSVPWCRWDDYPGVAGEAVIKGIIHADGSAWTDVTVAAPACCGRCK